MAGINTQIREHKIRQFENLWRLQYLFVNINPKEKETGNVQGSSSQLIIQGLQLSYESFMLKINMKSQELHLFLEQFKRVIRDDNKQR